jgi:hypothetical protein
MKNLKLLCKKDLIGKNGILYLNEGVVYNLMNYLIDECIIIDYLGETSLKELFYSEQETKIRLRRNKIKEILKD